MLSMISSSLARLLFIPSAHAQDGTVTPPPARQLLENPLQANSFAQLLDSLINFFLVLGAPVLTLFILYGAFVIMTAAGNPERVKTGRNTIFYAVLGFAILLMSKGIILVVKSLLTVL
jgi:hypothetical protein